MRGYEDEDLSIRLQEHEGELYIHMDVHSQWSKSLKQKTQVVLDMLEDVAVLLGYEGVTSVLPVENDKAIRFNKMFGLKELGTIDGKVVLHRDFLEGY